MMPDCKLDVPGAPVIASSALFPDWSKTKILTSQAACGRMSR